MLSELDETIRRLLTVEGQLDSSEVDVSFEIPNRDWSKGISKPTINCYLFDIREHRDLRNSGALLESNVANKASARRRLPMFVGLTYLITAWTRVVEDEHRLLFHALSTLMRFGVIPEHHVHGALRQHELPIHTQIAQPDGVLKSPGEFWTALENHLKPSINYLVYLALDFDRLSVGPPVLSSTVRFHSTAGDVREQVVQFGGTLRDKDAAPVGGAEVWIEGHRDSVRTAADGRFLLRVPSPGRYTIVARGETGLQRREVDVPANDFDLTLPGDDASASRAKKTR